MNEYVEKLKEIVNKANKENRMDEITMVHAIIGIGIELAKINDQLHDLAAIGRELSNIHAELEQIRTNSLFGGI